MLSLGVPFCEVCSETFVTSYYKFLRPIESFSPISPEIFLSDTQSVILSIIHLNPTGKSIEVEWFVDGIRRNGENESTFKIVAKDFGIGQHTAYCIVRDTTLLVRNDPSTLLRDSVLWNISVSNASDVLTDHLDKIPNHFFLEQNFPNPFNPATTIAFNLPISSFVTLTIYDMMGREIEILIAQEMSPGRFTQQWNASKLSGGIYICELRSGSYKQTIKLALIK